MNQFKPGDRVRRTEYGDATIPVGSEWTVIRHTTDSFVDGGELELEDDPLGPRVARWFQRVSKVADAATPRQLSAGADDVGWWSVDPDTVYPGTVAGLDLDGLGLEVRVQVRRRP